MPKPGFKTITVSERVYDKLLSNFALNRDKLLNLGVTTLSGYAKYLLLSGYDESKKLRALAKRIDKIPQKYVGFKVTT
jgi:hypothetical protein